MKAVEVRGPERCVTLQLFNHLTDDELCQALGRPLPASSAARVADVEGVLHVVLEEETVPLAGGVRLRIAGIEVELDAVEAERARGPVVEPPAALGAWPPWTGSHPRAWLARRAWDLDDAEDLRNFCVFTACFLLLTLVGGGFALTSVLIERDLGDFDVQLEEAPVVRLDPGFHAKLLAAVDEVPPAAEPEEPEPAAEAVEVAEAAEVEVAEAVEVAEPIEVAEPVEAEPVEAVPEPIEVVTDEPRQPRSPEVVERREQPERPRRGREETTREGHRPPQAEEQVAVVAEVEEVREQRSSGSRGGGGGRGGSTGTPRPERMDAAQLLAHDHDLYEDVRNSAIRRAQRAGAGCYEVRVGGGAVKARTSDVGAWNAPLTSTTRLTLDEWKRVERDFAHAPRCGETT